MINVEGTLLKNSFEFNVNFPKMATAARSLMTRWPFWTELKYMRNIQCELFNNAKIFSPNIIWDLTTETLNNLLDFF